REMARELSRIVWYGTGPSCDIRGELLDTSSHLVFSWRKKGSASPHTVHSALSGIYTFENLLAAVCVGDHSGLSPEQIKKGIESYVPANNRSQELQQGSNRLILDAYNANPGSMAAALKHLAAHPAQKKAAVLGDMFELGP